MEAYGYWGGYHLWWIFPLVMMVLCFVLMRGRMGRRWCCFGHGSDHDDGAVEILMRRYARGEIDRTEFEEKKRDLHELQKTGLPLRQGEGNGSE